MLVAADTPLQRPHQPPCEAATKVSQMFPSREKLFPGKKLPRIEIYASGSGRHYWCHV